MPVEFTKLFAFPSSPTPSSSRRSHSMLSASANIKPSRSPSTQRCEWNGSRIRSCQAEVIEEMFETVSFSLDNLPKPKDTLGYDDFEFLKYRPYFLSTATCTCWIMNSRSES
jgi:hypothetical protein